MKRFFFSLFSIVLVLIAVVLTDYEKSSYEKRLNNTFAITKFFYMELGSNYFEPNSYERFLGKKLNRAYPEMMQINKLDYIYE